MSTVGTFSFRNIPTDLEIQQGVVTQLNFSPVEILGGVGQSIVLRLQSSSGRFDAQSTGGVIAIESSPGTLLLSGTVSELNAYFDRLDVIRFTPQESMLGDNAGTIRFNILDGFSNSEVGITNLDIVEQKSLVVTIDEDIVDPFDQETSLREAILFANNIDADQDGLENDTITFAANMGDVFESGGTINLTGGTLVITSDITISVSNDTNSGARIILNGDINGDDMTRIDEAGNEVTVSHENLNFSDNVNILNVLSGSLIASGLVITGGYSNQEDIGGGLTIANGAVAAFVDTVFSGNRSNFSGGAILNRGELILESAFVEDNQAASGGGVANVFGTATLNNSRIAGNSSVGDGAGLQNIVGVLRLINSSISENTSSGNGGGIVNAGSLALTNSTFSENSAGLDGGAISSVGDLELINTTLTQNQAGRNGGGLYASGYASIFSSTLSGNSAGNLGGGIHHYFGQLTLSNSIVLGNGARANEEVSASAFDLSVQASIIGENGERVQDVFLETELGADGQTLGGVLSDNGGSVETIAILQGGLAANVGLISALNQDSFDLDGDGDTNEQISLDARGVNRIISGLLDVGAFEAEEAPTLNADFLNGSELADVIDGLSGRDTINGFGGDDILFGSSGFDNLDGQTGNDTLYGGAQADNLFGGEGDDHLNGGVGNDRLFGDNGADVLNGGISRDRLFGGAGDDTLNGGANNDLLNGNSGEDILIGLNGFDTLNGGSGNDVLSGGANADRLLGNQGDDALLGGFGRDRLSGGSGNDTLNGGSGSDVLAGNGGHDILIGNTGDDILVGAGGFDSLEGGEGSDVLTGGLNADQFIFAGDFGDDIITDFDFANPFERIDLSAITAITSFEDLVANHISETAGNAVIVAGENSITLEGVSVENLMSSDFLF